MCILPHIRLWKTVCSGRSTVRRLFDLILSVTWVYTLIPLSGDVGWLDNKGECLELDPPSHLAHCALFHCVMLWCLARYCHKRLCRGFSESPQKSQKSSEVKQECSGEKGIKRKCNLVPCGLGRGILIYPSAWLVLHGEAGVTATNFTALILHLQG